MNYRELIRRKLLEEVYNRMSDDDKRALYQLTKQEQDHTEVMQALSDISRKADKNHHSFLLDFAANIAGNGAWDGLLWIGSKLLKLK